MAEDRDIGDAALIEAVCGHAAQYVEYYVQGCGRVLTHYSLKQALTLYESFHMERQLSVQMQLPGVLQACIVLPLPRCRNGV
jgi:hypothetical protein